MMAQVYINMKLNIGKYDFKIVKFYYKDYKLHKWYIENPDQQSFVRYRWLCFCWGENHYEY